MTTDRDGDWLLEKGLPIHQASELLGVPAPTLRSWERRYGLPSTPRSGGGHRRYSAAALHQLRLMRDEVAHGRPAADAARRVRMSLDVDDPGARWVDEVLDASRLMDRGAIVAVLDRVADEQGLPFALDHVLMPAMRQIGNWWAAGSCDVEVEHFTTAAVRGWLSRLTAFTEVTRSRPIVLACGPRDTHTLGLEALAVLLVHDGREAYVLGARTPAQALATCVQRTHAVAAVVVSQLPSHRRVTAHSLEVAAATGCQTFYAGNAFLFASARKGVPGTYLGESLADAATRLGTID